MADTENKKDDQMNADGSINIPIEDGDAPEKKKAESSDQKEQETEQPAAGDGQAAAGDKASEPETKDKGDEPEAPEADGKAGGADTDTQEDEDEAEDGDDAVDGEWKSLDGKESSADSSSSGFFKKKEKKDKKDIQIEELTDRVRRQMAEFDNFRKRTDKEKSQMFEVGAKSVIEKILPIVDSFERGLAVADKSDPFVEGMEKTYRQLMTTLESLDVKPIEAVGKEFDPNLHNAVMHVDDDSVGDNIVVEELQKGYTYRGSVVRYSMVKVAN